MQIVDIFWKIFSYCNNIFAALGWGMIIILIGEFLWQKVFGDDDDSDKPDKFLFS